MTIEPLDLTPSALLAGAERAEKLGFPGGLPLLDRLVLAERMPARERHRIGDELGDDRAGPLPAARPVGFEHGDGLVDAIPRAVVELAEGAQQANALGEPRAMRVEDPHHVEVLPERARPLVDVVVAADPVDEGHARAAGPAQDLHLGLVVGTIRQRRVDDVEDRRAREDRRQKGALVGELGAAFEGIDERRDERRPIGRAAFAFLQPRERARRFLESRRVDRVAEHAAVVGPERKAGAGARRPRLFVDAHGVVLDERRHHARLALVHAADDGERGNRAFPRVRHADSTSMRSQGSPRARTRWRQMRTSSGRGVASSPAPLRPP